MDNLPTPPAEEALYSNVPPPPPEENIYKPDSPFLTSLKQVGSSILGGKPEEFNQPPTGSPMEKLSQLTPTPIGASRLSAAIDQPPEIAGKAVEQQVADTGHPILGKAAGFITSTALNPKTWIGMLPSLIPEDISKEIPNLLQKTANIPSKATELSGYEKAGPLTQAPTETEIQSAIQKVRDTVKNVWNEHGEMLNKAKSEIGLPVEKSEIADSVRKYGNEFNLDINKPLQLPNNMKQMAPEMEEGLAGPVNEKGLQAYLKGTMGGGTSPNTGKPLPKVNIWNVRGDPSEISKLGFGNSPASIPEDVLKANGIQLPGQKNLNMPFTIGDHDTPQQLMTEIERFKSNLPYIAKQDQAKAASYLQDQIVQQGVFKQDTAIGKTNGVLKSQYGDLSGIISNSSDKLTAAKAKMGDLYDTMKSVSKKLSGESGGAESYLRRLFTSKNASMKDDLKALTKLDTLAGTNTVENLFQKFAGEVYNQPLGQSVHTIFQAPYAMLTSPKFVISPAMKYGPYAAKAAKFGAIGSTEGNMSALQSVKDRLNNVNNQ